MDEPEPVILPIEDSLDLHAFAPRDVRSVVDEYLRQAAARGFAEVRLIHGKGAGTQRAIVRSVLAGHPDVLALLRRSPRAGRMGRHGGGAEALVPIQLDRSNGTDASQGVILVADTAVAVAEVSIDAPPTGDMVAVVRAGEGGPLRHPEVRFDGIEPGGVGGRGDRVDVQAPEQRQEARMIMDVVQVIHDDEEALARVAGSQPPKGLAHLDDPLAPPEQATQAVGMDVVEAEEHLGAFAAVIGGPHAAAAGERRPQATPPKGLSSRGPHSSKQITAARGGHVR